MTTSSSASSTVTKPVTKRRRPLTLADLTDAQRAELACCCHEAGHAVAATVLGGEIRAAVVGSSRAFGLEGATVHKRVPPGAWPSVLLAGPWAEARWHAGGHRAPTGREVDAVLAGTGCRDHAELTAAGAMVSDVATGELANLLTRCWPAVIAVAVQLHRTGEVSHENVCSALSIPPRGNLHHLSLIRSGSAPGSFTVTPAVV